VNDQAAFLLRVSAFGLVSGVVYWFISYEAFGTVALLLLGVGSGFAGLVLIRQRRLQGAGREPIAELLRRFAGMPAPDPPGPKSLEDDDMAVLPAPSIWPFAVSLGLVIALSGLVFGLWLVILGLGLALYAGWGWVAAIMRETRYGHLEPTDQPAEREEAESERGPGEPEQETLRRR